MFSVPDKSANSPTALEQENRNINIDNTDYHMVLYLTSMRLRAGIALPSIQISPASRKNSTNSFRNKSLRQTKS